LFIIVYEEAKLLPSDTFLSRKNAQKCVCGRGSAPDPTGGAYSAPPDTLTGNGGGDPGKGRETKRREREGERSGREGWGGEERKGEGISPERKSWLPCNQLPLPRL